MSPTQETVRVQLNYPLQQVDQPLLYRLVVDYNLIPNIRRANIDPRTGGFIFLELQGEKEALERGLAFLQQSGIAVSAIGLDGAEEWAV